MGEAINFNKARKAREKARQQAEAAANRSKFGRTKSQKSADRLNAEAAARRLDDARRESDGDA